MDRELNPKQQTSEAIRAAESILVITGQNPTIDQVTSTVALGDILRKLGKKTHTLVSDAIPAGARFVADGKVDRKLDGLRDFIMQLDLSKSEVDKVKYTIEEGKLNVHITPYKGGFSPNDVGFTYGDYHYDLVIIIGVATYSRIEKLYLQNVDLFTDVPLINIDFHRVNENYGAINLLDTNAASLSEMLVALAESLQTGIIDEPIATTLLTGIMASTDRFTANHTTPKALTVAAQMMALGANQQKVVKGLYQNQPRQENRRPDQRPKVDQKALATAMEAVKTPAPQIDSVPKTEAVNPQPHKQIIAGGVLQRADSEIDQSAVVEPEQPLRDNIIEMLPPSHIEISDEAIAEVHPDQVALTAEPEPLINDIPESAAPQAQPVQNNTPAVPVRNPLEDNSSPKAQKGVNPANNPLFITR